MLMSESGANQMLQKCDLDLQIDHCGAQTVQRLQQNPASAICLD